MFTQGRSGEVRSIEYYGISNRYLIFFYSVYGVFFYLIFFGRSRIVDDWDMLACTTGSVRAHASIYL